MKTKEYALFTIVRYFSFFLLSLRGIILANLLGPEMFGIYGIVSIYLQYLTLTGMGFPLAVNVELSKKDDKENILFVGSAFFVTAMTAVILILTALYLTYTGFNIFSQDNSNWYPIIIIGIAIVQNFQQLFLNIFRSSKKIKTIVICELLVSVVTFSSIFFFKDAKTKIHFYFLMFFSTLAISVFIYWIYSPLKISFLRSPEYFKKNLKVGLPLLLYSFSFFFFYLITRTIVGTFYSLEENGLYTFAFNISSAFFLGIDSVTWLLFSDLIARYTNNTVIEAKSHFYVFSQKFSTCLFGLVFLFMICLPVLFIYFPKYHDSLILLEVLLLSQCIMNIPFAHITYLIANKLQFKLSILTLINVSAITVVLYVMAKLHVNIKWIGFATMIGIITYVNTILLLVAIKARSSYFQIGKLFRIREQLFVIALAALMILGYNFVIYLVPVFFIIARYKTILSLGDDLKIFLNKINTYLKNKKYASR
ncbi:MAG: oligosaccharide flippase family protein [Bacteroidota bacterium]